MSTENLLNLISKADVAVYLGKIKTKELKRDYYISSILVIQLKKYYENLNLPEQQYTCEIYMSPYIHKNGDKEAPYVKLQFLLVDGRFIKAKLTERVLQNHINDLHEYVRVEIIDSLMEYSNR